ncbi:MAG: epoxyqueuosine reductase QueH [Raoultibacter sp.]|jgi:predicted adenine nucleotide alpha hydrolase (AANH) superfamily ATPase
MKLLLHACCGPCSLEPVRLLLEEGHELCIAYMNSNIHPEDEYTHRRDTLMAWADSEDIPVIEGVYNPELWEKSAGALAAQDSYAREDRCRACYRLRFEEAADYAQAHDFDGLCTTLSVSPYQFTDIIAEELKAAASSRGLKLVFQDFRPHYAEATRRSRDIGMYRQNYCGCRISEIEAQAEREERKRKRKAEKLERKRAREQSIAQTGGCQ